MGSQIARLRAIGKPNCQAKSCQAEGFWRLKKDLPQQLDVPAISKRKCKTYGALKYLVSNARDQLCEGAEEGKDNCGGDSGGPLFKRAEYSTPWFQVGVVSFGSTICEQDYQVNC